MATEKTLNTRIGLKVDTLENWGKSTLPLKKGEVAFATVAATAGTGLSEPVVMMKIGEDGVKTFKDIEWNFYAKASDVIAAAKSEESLRTFINGVIADAGIATNEAMEALAGRVTTTEGAIATLNGNDETAGSVAKSIKDAIAALNLDTTYVAIEEGKSLVSDTEITKLAGISAEAKKVEASETNGNIKIDGVETVVYTHPDKHAIDDVTGLQDALDGKQAAGDYAAEVHTHVKADITDFAHTHTVAEVTDFAEKVEAYDYATKTEAQGYANAKDEAIAAAKKAGDDAQAEVDNLEIFVGQLPEGATATTVVGYIDAKTANIASDETVGAIDDRVKAIEDDYLVEADKTELQDQITANANAIELLTNGVSAEEVDGVNDLIQYVKDHGTEVTGMKADIKANADAIAEHEELAAETYETKEDAGKKLTEAKGYTDTAKSAVIGTADDASTTDTIKGAKKYAEEKASAAETAAKGHADGLNTAMNARVEALEAIDHEHANKELLDTYTHENADIGRAITQSHIHSFEDTDVEDAITKAHVHENIDQLNVLTPDVLLELMSAEENANSYTDEQIAQAKTDASNKDAVILSEAQKYADGLAGNYATAEQGGKADTALQSITTTENGGLKVTNNNQIDIDDAIVFVFDCGDSNI